MNHMEATQEHMALAQTEADIWPLNAMDVSGTSNNSNSSNASSNNSNSTKPCDGNGTRATQQIDELGKCKCIGTHSSGYPLIGTGDGKSVEVDGYPKSVGSECKAWDLGVYPGKCTMTSTSEKFCAEKWCYVDPCHCDTESFPQVSSFFPDTELHYSYEACGSKDFFTHQFNNLACGNPENQNEKSCEQLLKCRWVGTKCISNVMEKCVTNDLISQSKTTSAAKESAKVKESSLSTQRDSVSTGTKGNDVSAASSTNGTTDADVDVSGGSTKAALVMFLYATIPIELIIIACIYYKVKQNNKVLLDDSDRAKIRFKMTIGGADQEKLAADKDLMNRVVTHLKSIVVDIAGKETTAEDVDITFDFEDSVVVSVKVLATPPSDQTVLAALQQAIAGPLKDASVWNSVEGFTEVCVGQVMVTCTDPEVEAPT